MSAKINLLPIKFGTYELPVFKESRKGEWYEYGSAGGEWKNRYPQFLTKLYNESSKHAVIINSKCKFIVGKGFCVEGDINYKDRAKIKAFLRHPNDTDNMTELLTKIVKDKKVYGGFCMGVRINANKQIAALDHINFADVRKGVDDDIYYYTDDWKSRSPKNNEDFKEMILFPWDDTINTSDNYIIYYKEYRPDLNIYPLGDYVSAVPYISADAEIANFTLNSIQQNLSASYIISFNNGEPTAEEMRNIEQRFRDYATGTDNAAKPLLSFTDQNSDHPQIIPIPETGLTDRYNQLNEQIRQEIFTAHGIVSPMLFGVKTETGLGNNADEILTAASLYQNLQIDGEQAVLDDLFNEIIVFNGYRKSLRIIKIEPVQKALSEQTIINSLTQNEIRERIGMEPLEVESNKTAEAIGMLSPLVATKVLDNMSTDEIRNLVGLTNLPASERVQMDDQLDDVILNQLERTGFRTGELEIISSHISKITCFEDARESEKELFKGFNFSLDRVLTENEKNVLDIIKRNPKTPNTEISKALKITIEKVNESIQGLQDANALDKNFKPTPEAQETIQEPKEKVFIVYKYVQRDDVPNIPLSRSRVFCRRLLALAETRRYTLNQLEMLRNGQGDTGINIFLKRGGWYHNPETDITTPYCRHIWQQQIVRLKN